MVPFLPVSPASAGIDFRYVLAELYPKLNAANVGDLVYWTEAELYEWADEAAKRLARKLGVFVERDATLSIAAAGSTANLPARHISTIHATITQLSEVDAVLYSSTLYSVNVQELEALDAAWRTRTGTQPANYLLDDASTLTVRVYPIVVGGSRSLALIFHRFPVTISAANYTLAAPMCMQEYFSWLMLSEARRKESDASMIEVAEAMAGRVDLMEKVISEYWGASQ